MFFVKVFLETVLVGKFVEEVKPTPLAALYFKLVLDLLEQLSEESDGRLWLGNTETVAEESSNFLWIACELIQQL